MHRFKTNIIIFWLAIVLSTSLFYLTQSSVLFSASVLSLQDAETIKAKSRDVWYKNKNNILDVFLSKKLININNIKFSIIYDQSNIELDMPQISSQTEYKIISNNDWELVIKFVRFWEIDYDYSQSLFELPFHWDSQITSQILIADWVANLANLEDKKLAVGVLNTDKNKHANY